MQCQLSLKCHKLFFRRQEDSSSRWHTQTQTHTECCTDFTENSPSFYHLQLQRCSVNNTCNQSYEIHVHTSRRTDICMNHLIDLIQLITVAVHLSLCLRLKISRHLCHHICANENTRNLTWMQAASTEQVQLAVFI